jgi:aerobic C4-dicarboxylate transport protein
VFRLVHILMRAAPIGAFGAIAFTIGKYGIGSLVNLAGWWAVLHHFAAVRAGDPRHRRAAVRLLRGQADPLPQGRAAAGAGHVLVRVGAALADAEDGGGRLQQVGGGLVVPTGYSFNLDGTNIYMTLAALFIAQATDTD